MPPTVQSECRRETEGFTQGLFVPPQNAYLEEGHLSATMPSAGFPKKQI